MGERRGWEVLNNSVVFTWGFVEMLVWFWVSAFRSCMDFVRAGTLGEGLTVEGRSSTDLPLQVFTTLREERKSMASKVQDKRQAEVDML